MWNIVIYDMKNFFENKGEMVSIKKVENEPDNENILRIDGKTYRWCGINPQEKIFAVEEIVLSESPVEQSSYDFVCPFCTKTHFDAWEYEDEGEEIECIYCQSLITFDRTIEDAGSDDVWVTYNVQPIKRNNIVSV